MHEVGAATLSQRRVISGNVGEPRQAYGRGLFKTWLGPKPAAVSRMVSIDLTDE